MNQDIALERILQDLNIGVIGVGMAARRIKELFQGEKAEKGESAKS